MSPIARPYPREFRDDVVRVARNREDGVTIEQVATDPGVHPMTLYKWMRQADIDEGAKPGKSTGESAELRELRRRNRLLERENEVLRRARRTCRRRICREKGLPAREGVRRRWYPRGGDVSGPQAHRQRYYRWSAQPVTDAELVEAYRVNALCDAHSDDPEFGHRFLVDDACDAGEPMAARTAWRICSDNGWWSAFGKRKRGKNGKTGPPVHDDLVGRDFTTDEPNQLWLSDITEHQTDERTLHSMVGSIGRVGAAGVNAAMERFFSLLQKNVLNRCRWNTREELRIAIVTWIERTYHSRRRQAGLGRLTPVEFEAIVTPPASQAA